MSTFVSELCSLPEYCNFGATLNLMSTYVSELRSLPEHCNFGATLNLMLRDKLVWFGIARECITIFLLCSYKI